MKKRQALKIMRMAWNRRIRGLRLGFPVMERIRYGSLLKAIKRIEG